MKNIFIVGCGMGNSKELTKIAEETLKSSSIVIGSERILCSLDCLKTGFQGEIVPLTVTDKIIEKINSSTQQRVSLVVSGDTSFFSLASVIERKKSQIEGEFSLEFVPGISCLSYFLSKIKLSLSGVETISLHGRKKGILPAVSKSEKLFGITSNSGDIKYISQTLTKNGLGDLKIFIGENLSYETEKITETTVKEAGEGTYSDLVVFLIQNPNPVSYVNFKDETFIRDKVPMTKQEVRLLAINKLGITKNSVVYDIGAGTGSVSCEIAFNYESSSVISFEREELALDLINKNKEALDCPNIKIVSSNAPAGFENEKPADFAFIGGSGGNLKEILDTLFERNQNVRVCITAVSLETVSLVLEYIKSKNIENYEVVQAAISKTKKLGSSNMLFGFNPIFIISFGGKDFGK